MINTEKSPVVVNFTFGIFFLRLKSLSILTKEVSAIHYILITSFPLADSRLSRLMSGPASGKKFQCLPIIFVLSTYYRKRGHNKNYKIKFHFLFTKIEFIRNFTNQKLFLKNKNYFFRAYICCWCPSGI